MSESNDVKQVTVALSHPDELNPRRRRRTRKFKDDMETQTGGSAPAGIVDVQGQNTGAQVVMVQKDIPIPTTTTGSTGVTVSAPSATVTTVNTVPPTPIVASTVVVGGAMSTPGASGGAAAAAVHIRDKKNNIQTHQTGGTSAGTNAPAVNAPAAPKIVPHKKRLTQAPVAQTLKKPKFVVPTPLSQTPTSNPKRDESNVLRGDKGGVLKTEKGGSPAPAPAGDPGVGPKARKRFTERRIKIEVKPTVKTRKSRKLLIERIDSMPIQAVRRLLLKKGVLKSKSTVPPEPMMRSMLRDYYLLKQSE
jgi:hypothetical protein